MIEARGFRDYHEAIASEDAVIVGISADSADSHRRFRAAHELPFGLISDPDRRIIRLYDVQRRIPFLRNKRVTYVIDRSGVIRDVLHHEIAIGKHKDDVLERLRAINGT